MYLELAIFALFIFCYSIVAGRIERAATSGPIVFVVAGLLMGPLGLGWFDGDVSRTELRVLAGPARHGRPSTTNFRLNDHRARSPAPLQHAAPSYRKSECRSRPVKSEGRPRYTRIGGFSLAGDPLSLLEILPVFRDAFGRVGILYRCFKW